MKIKITYLPGEEEAASNIMCFSVARLGGLYAVKVNKSDAHPPFKHIYLSIKKPGNSSGACVLAFIAEHP